MYEIESSFGLIVLKKVFGLSIEIIIFKARFFTSRRRAIITQYICMKSSVCVGSHQPLSGQNIPNVWRRKSQLMIKNSCLSKPQLTCTSKVSLWCCLRSRQFIAYLEKYTAHYKSTYRKVKRQLIKLVCSILTGKGSQQQQPFGMSHKRLHGFCCRIKDWR